MEEIEFITYSEWAENELVWGKGMYNWCQSYTKEEWGNYKPLFDYNKEDNIEIPF